MQNISVYNVHHVTWQSATKSGNPRLAATLDGNAYTSEVNAILLAR